MKNQFNKNIALEDSHNREVVSGCYDCGKSSGAFVLKGGPCSLTIYEPLKILCQNESLLLLAWNVL